MSEATTETTQEVLAGLDVKAVLEYLDYRVDTIQETDKAVRCFCPVHKEQVFRTYSVDKKTKKGKCSYTPCPARRSQTLIELVAMTKEIEPEEALVDLVNHFDLDVEVPGMEEMLEKKLQGAKSDLEAGNLDKAYGGFRHVLGMNPDSVSALEGLAVTCEQQGNLDEAMECLKRLAASQHRSKNYEEAAKVYQRFLQSSPGEVEARLRLAECLHHLGKKQEMIDQMTYVAKIFEQADEPDKALEIYHRIEALKPETSEVNHNVVDLLVKVGRADEAIEQIAASAKSAIKEGNTQQALDYYREIIEIDPTRDDFRSDLIKTVLNKKTEDDAETIGANVALCLEQIEGFAGADAGAKVLESLEMLHQRYPEDVAVLERLYEVLHEQAQDERALEVRNQLIESYILAGQKHLEAEKMEQAESAFSRASELDPDSIPALTGLLEVAEKHSGAEAQADLRKRMAALYTVEKQYENAIPLYEKYLELEPDDMQARLQLVECLHAVGRGQEMVANMQDIAKTYEQEEQTDKAIEIYERISSFDMENVEVRNALVQLLVRSNRVDEAAEHVAALADFHRAEGRVEEAAEAYKQVLELDANRDDIRLKCIQNLTAKPELSGDDLNECLALMDGFIQEEWSNMALQILEDLRNRFPGHTTVLEKIYEVYRKHNRDQDADGLAFDLAQNYEEMGEYDEALKWVEPLIQMGGPGRPIALTLKASICKAAGDIPAAVGAHLEIIDDHESAGDFESAIPFYQSVLDVDPKNIDLMERYLQVLSNSQMHEERIEALETALPQLEEHEDPEAALRVLDMATEGLPPSPEYLLARSSILSNLNRDDEARRDKIHAADFYAEKDNAEKSIAILEQLAQADPHDLEVIEKLADFRLATGDTKKALITYQSLAELYAEQGSVDAQLDVLLKISEVQPEDTETLKQILALYDQLENTRDARELRNKMTRIYMARKAYKEALGVCRETLESDPEDVFSLETCMRIYDAQESAEDYRETALRLLDVYDKQGEKDRAVKLLDTLEQRFPKDAHILQLRLVAQCESGNWTAAMEALEHVVAIHDENQQPEQSLEAVKSALQYERAPHVKLLPHWLRLCRETGLVEENWDTTNALIDALENELQTALATDALRDILESKPDFDLARERYIRLLQDAGLHRRAMEALREWAQVLCDQEEWEAADQRYSQALHLASDDVDLLGEVLDFRVARNRKEGTAELALQLANALDDQGLVNRAIFTLDQALQVDPGRRDLRNRILELEDLIASPEELRERYVTMFKTQMEQENHENAKAVITEAVSKYPTDFELRRMLADLLSTMDRREELMVELSSLAIVQTEMERYTEALQTIGEILEIDPANRRAQEMQADIQKRMSEDEVALREFRKITKALGSEGPEKIAEMLASGSAVPSDSLEMLPLLKEYTFTNFVVGTRNNFAYATAMAISKTPGGDYNPLFLYGDCGLGKTHLLHGIANEMLNIHPELRVLYTSSEEFTNALIEAIQNNTIREFRAIHKSPDVFLIDDVHFLAEKERAQEEFFQIFNALYQANRQIVLTSDRPPKEIAHLERRLRSRFGAGIIVDIAPPDFETRMAIVRHHLDENDAELTDEIVTLLAQSIESNIRELKSAVVQILARMKLTNEEPTPEMVKQIVEQIREN